MQNQIDIEWPDVLEAFYGHALTPRQVAVWEEYLSEQAPTGEELIQSIRKAADDTIKPEEWRVTVRDLLKWLKKYRREQEAASNKNATENHIKAFIQHWREKLRRGAQQDDILIAIDETFQFLPITRRNDIVWEILQ